ncbi:MAG TPA: thiamine pyrophosphate-binding protein [Steroidobacteraceae bacterium]|jgi:acetolactate synthase-1/2/3 large subunit|nr:thiamine pyrophosphate-binding protein [Steroidobacteraceae bacterium]
MTETSGGEVLARMLQAEGVEKVFGIIDGTYFGFYSSLHRLGIEIVTPRHESCAAHMAGAYARLTGKLGVCMASNGPGVANLLPGLVVENAEGNRVLAITSCRRPQIVYPDRGGAYQAFDQVGAIKHFAKWSNAVVSFDRVAELGRAALRNCHDGRPGVVHLDVPETIMNGKVKAEVPTWQPRQFRRTHALVPAPDQVVEAAELLAAADLALIHAGSGVIHAAAYDELRRVAELLCAPVTTSWAARGVLPETHELALPMPLIKLNNQVRNDADVVLVVGSRLGETDWWGKAPYWRRPSEQTMIQVDLDGHVLGANKPATVAALADAKLFLGALADALEGRAGRMNLDARRRQLAKYRDVIRTERAKLDEKLQDFAVPMNPAHIAHVCQRVFPEGTTLVADGGNTAVWAMMFHEMRVPNTLLSTFKFGMLGAGVAQALGAAVARPDAPVCCIIGDGAMGFHPQEIETAVRNGLRVVYVVVCDRQWGMVKMNQQFALKPLKTLIRKSLGPDETIKADLGEIRFDKVAEAMGAHGERVADPRELKGALERALASGGPAVVHVDVDPVKHMWAPGLMHFKDMHLEPKG